MNRRYGLLQLALGGLLLVAPSVASSQEKQKQPAQQKQAPAKLKQECATIRSADGSCADVKLVESAARRASVISSSQASYFGTPMGTVGLSFIPHERIFRDDPVVFGIPTQKISP